jgi:hypothetical protein
MERDAREPDRRLDDEEAAREGMIGSDAEEPGPGRDTARTDAAQPTGTVAMSEGDPLRTRLGAHVEGAGVIGYDVAAAERQAAGDHAEPEGAEPTTAGGASQLAAEPGLGADSSSYTTEPDGRDDRPGYVTKPGPAADAGYDEQAGATASRPVLEDEQAQAATASQPGATASRPVEAAEGEAGRPDPATYTGEETDVAGRAEYADRGEPGGTPVYGDEPARIDRAGGGERSIFGTTDEPAEDSAAGVDRNVYEEGADQAKRPRDL